MSLELKEPRQAGDPAGLESNDAALTNKSTGISAAGPDLTQPERLDPSRAPSDLVPPGSDRDDEPGMARRP